MRSVAAAAVVTLVVSALAGSAEAAFYSLVKVPSPPNGPYTYQVLLTAESGDPFVFAGFLRLEIDPGVGSTILGVQGNVEANPFFLSFFNDDEAPAAVSYDFGEFLAPLDASGGLVVGELTIDMCGTNAADILYDASRSRIADDLNNDIPDNTFTYLATVEPLNGEPCPEPASMPVLPPLLLAVFGGGVLGAVRWWARRSQV